MVGFWMRLNGSEESAVADLMLMLMNLKGLVTAATPTLGKI